MANQGLVKKDAAMQVKGLLEKYRGQITAALPRHVSADRIMRVAVGAISRTPQLGECTPESLFSCIVQSSTLGLEPSGPLGEAYMVPFWNNKKGVREATFIPGYRGLINLARRSGDVTLFYADVICENDKYKIRRGSEPQLEHEIALGDRGKPIAYYAVFHTKDGAKDFEVMTEHDIEGIRKRSKAGDSGPWQTDYEEMAKKTVIRRLAKRAPMSVELAKAVEIDNRVAMGEDPDFSDVIDTIGVDVSTDIPKAKSPMETKGAASKPAPPAAQNPEPKPAPAAAEALQIGPEFEPEELANKPEPPAEPADDAPPPEEPAPQSAVDELKDRLRDSNFTQKATAAMLRRVNPPWLKQDQGFGDLTEPQCQQILDNWPAFRGALQKWTEQRADEVRA